MNAAIDAVAVGAARAPRADLDAALAQPVRCALDGDLGVIGASGADVIAFLQAQLTNDTQTLGADGVQLTGYCTAKGRLLAVFDQWRTVGSEAEVLLQLPREIVAGVLKRLSMFVLRSKVRLIDASAQWRTTALVGPGSGEWLRARFGRVPALGQAIDIDGVRIQHARAGGSGGERFVLRAPAATAAALDGAMASLPQVDVGVWWWSQVDAAVPTVVAATQESFVPQMINLEVLGGVNFKKGCYPGQEVVARSQYLGKLRRRMSIGHADQVLPVGAGDDVYFAGSTEPAGKIVASAAAPGGGIDLLFECPVDKMDPQSVRLAGDVPVVLRPLPYELIDITA